MELLLNALAALLASWLVRWVARRVAGELPGDLATGMELWLRLTLRLLMEVAGAWAAGRLRRSEKRFPQNRSGRSLAPTARNPRRCRNKQA